MTSDNDLNNKASTSFLFNQFHSLPASIPHLLWQLLIAPLIKVFNNLKTLLLKHSSSYLKLIILSQRPTASEFIIELPEVSHPYSY